MRARRLNDELLARITDGVLASGRLDAGGGFMTAYCHTPDELSKEVSDAGFHATEVFAVEGAGWLLFEKDSGRREGAEVEGDGDGDGDEALLAAALRAARATEAEPALLGVSSHLLAVARAPA